MAYGGSELHEGEGHYNDSWKPKGFDTKKIFVSPSLKYSGCPVYAKKQRYVYLSFFHNVLPALLLPLSTPLKSSMFEPVDEIHQS